MRILFVVHQFFPQWYTGTERFVLNLCKQLQRMGHFVEVLTYGYGDESGFSFQENACIKKYSFQNVPVIAVKHLNPPDSQTMSFTIFDETLEPLFNTIVSKNKYDIVHIAHPFRCGTAIQSSRNNKIPILLTLTDFWMVCPKAIGITQKGELCLTSDNGKKCVICCYSEEHSDLIFKRFETAGTILNEVDLCTTSTSFLKSVIQNNYPSSKVKVIRFGKDYTNIQGNHKMYFKDSIITIGFLSTLQPHKGAHILIEAFNKLNPHNIKLKIYGHYFDHAEYFKNLKDLADGKQIEFCNAYKYEDFQKIFDELDLVIVPSIWWENSPLVLLRSLAHHVPAIVSDLEGMTEIIKDGENGFVFEVGNIDSLAEVLRSIENDPTILNKLKSQITYPKRIEEEAFEYEKLYRELVKNNHPQ